MKIFIIGKKILHGLKWFCTRFFCLYVIFFAIWIAIGGGLAWTNARLRSFNRTRPDVSFLAEFMINEKPAGIDKWEDAAYYYGSIRKIFSQIPDSAGFEGLCYFYLGQQDKATDLLKYAVKNAGQIAVFHYNLGVLYYNQGDYEKAAKSISRIFSGDQNLLIEATLKNKFFKQIFSTYDKEIPFQRLWSDFMRQASVVLIKSYYGMEDYGQAAGAARFGLRFLAPEDKTIAWFAADAALKVNQTDLALAYVEAGLKNNSQDPLLYEVLSKIFQRVGEPEKAARASVTAKMWRMRGIESHLMDISPEKLRVF